MTECRPDHDVPPADLVLEDCGCCDGASAIVEAVARKIERDNLLIDGTVGDPPVSFQTLPDVTLTVDMISCDDLPMHVSGYTEGGYEWHAHARLSGLFRHGNDQALRVIYDVY